MFINHHHFSVAYFCPVTTIKHKVNTWSLLPFFLWRPKTCKTPPLSGQNRSWQLHDFFFFLNYFLQLKKEKKKIALCIVIRSINTQTHPTFDFYYYKFLLTCTNIHNKHCCNSPLCFSSQLLPSASVQAQRTWKKESLVGRFCPLNNQQKGGNTLTWCWLGQLHVKFCLHATWTQHRLLFFLKTFHAALQWGGYREENTCPSLYKRRGEAGALACSKSV